MFLVGTTASKLSAVAAGALIGYVDVSNEFVYSLDGSKNSILVNQESGGATYDGVCYTGNPAELGATQVPDIPLEYTLGSEIMSNSTFDTDISGWGAFGGTASFDAQRLKGTAPAGGGLVTFYATILENLMVGNIYYYNLTFDAGTSGITKSQILDSLQGNGGISKTNHDDFLIIRPTTTSTQLRPYTPSLADTTYLFYDDVTLKQVNYTTAVVGLYNVITAQWDWIPASSFTDVTYTPPAGTYSQIVVLATEPSAADKTYLESNIYAISDMFHNETTGLTSIVKADIQHLYVPMARQGAYWQDLTVALGTLNEHVTSIVKYTNGTNNTVALTQPNIADIHNESVTTLTTVPNVFITDPSNSLFKFTVTLVVTFGTAYVNGINMGFTDGGWNINNDFNGAYSVGTYVFEVIGYYNGGDDFKVNFDGLNYPTFDATLTLDAEEITSFVEIPNFADTVYTNADFNQKGHQTSRAVFDETGRMTGVSKTALKFYGNGYINTQWNPTLITPWTLTETIDTVQQVVLDTDNTNENANYLLGKGTYPKVAADLYATYSQTEFKVEA